ncbi:cyclic nucleotide-binding domain-containing protein [Babesia caballi]|uniref:Cyclic nucleotide-binding domain-containing protein n=1 Tax=Babesia caballi TaxID=5871 RepID=A0AAV4M6E7_BABCB|nr:cyclic nucleotide-binding domain-containing protein [Babesia caballi]
MGEGLVKPIMADADGSGGSRVSSVRDTSAVSATTRIMRLAAVANVMLVRYVELGLKGVGVVRKGNEKARTGSIPQSDAVTERTVEKCFGVLGRTTGLDEGRGLRTHLQISSEWKVDVDGGVMDKAPTKSSRQPYPYNLQSTPAKRVSKAVDGSPGVKATPGRVNRPELLGDAPT